MEPVPDALYVCPNCKTHYRRPWIGEPDDRWWSDGKECTENNYEWGYDPLIRCSTCNELFATHTSHLKNKWGFSLPKDIKFLRTSPITIDHCLQALHQKDIVNALGKEQAMMFCSWTENSSPHDEYALGILVIRMMIWQKINDRNRYNTEKRLDKAEEEMYHDNLRKMLNVYPLTNIPSDYEMYKAEIYRNLGEFGKSLSLLVKIKTDRRLRIPVRKLIWQNLIFNKRPVCLTISLRNLSWAGSVLRQIGIG